MQSLEIVACDSRIAQNPKVGFAWRYWSQGYYLPFSRSIVSRVHVPALASSNLFTSQVNWGRFLLSHSCMRHAWNHEILALFNLSFHSNVYARVNFIDRFPRGFSGQMRQIQWWLLSLRDLNSDFKSGAQVYSAIAWTWKFSESTCLELPLLGWHRLLKGRIVISSEWITVHWIITTKSYWVIQQIVIHLIDRAL